MRVSANPLLITPESLHDLQADLLADERPKVVASDFDKTLCHSYIFDPETNSNLAVIDEDLAAAASRVPLIVATATRAMHPKINQIWESGMIAKGGRLITENGGVVIKEDGQVCWRAVDTTDIGELHERVKNEVSESLKLPEGMKIIAKPGMTLLVVRAQDSEGRTYMSLHEELSEAVQTIAGPQWAVVDGGRSLSVQHTSVSKIRAVENTIPRSDYCLVGMGDSPNDINLLEGSDISIAVGDRIAADADWQVEASVGGATKVLQAIGEVATGFRGWVGAGNRLRALY